MFAQILPGSAGRKGTVLNDHVRGDDLPTMTGVGNTGGMVEDGATVPVTVAEERVPFLVGRGAVQADADAQFPDLAPIRLGKALLQGDGKLQGVVLLKDDEEAIAGGVQDTAIKTLDFGLAEVIVLAQSPEHRLAVFIPEAGGAFDVSVAEDGVEGPCRRRRQNAEQGLLQLIILDASIEFGDFRRRFITGVFFQPFAVDLILGHGRRALAGLSQGGHELLDGRFVQGFAV